MTDLALRAWRRFFRHDEWHIGIVNAPIHCFLDERFEPRVKWIEPVSREGFAADPFLCPGPDGLRLLYERFDYRSRRGWIEQVMLNEQGSIVGEPRKVLAEAWHLAYPYIFNHAGGQYCVPDAGEGGKVLLYRVDEPGGSLQFQKVLVDAFAGVDNSIVQYQGKWWMFSADAHAGPNSSLYIWYADDPLGSWQPHAGNPVKVDDYTVRSAGTPFVHEGVLYRPSQDCRQHYGEAVIINRVEVIDADVFRETPVRRVVPSPDWPYRQGLHTLSSMGDKTLIDAKRVVFSSQAFIKAFHSAFGKLA